MMFSQFIGIPFVDKGHTVDGADCYGLIRLIYKESKAIDIPEFSSSCKDTKRIFADYLKQISEHWYSVTDLQAYDVIAMAYDVNHPRIVQHFAVYIGNGMIIHSLDGVGSFIAKLSDFKSYIKGTYRWKASTSQV